MHLHDSDDQQLGQWIALATAIVSAAGSAGGSGMFSGKAHFSPWGFLYDDYPTEIWKAEKAIAEATQQPIPPAPAAPGAKPVGGSAYQASMQAIVPRYVPGSEQMISNYDRRLNEAGGAYEVTYGKQLVRLDALLKGQTVPPPAMTTALIPQQSASSARPVSAQPNLPALRQIGQQTAPAPGQQPIMQSSMFGSLENIPLPLLIGGAAVGLVLLLSMDKGSSGGGGDRRPRR